MRLRDHSVLTRLGLTCLLLVLLGGLAASVAQIFLHHHNRDEKPGLTLDDLRAAYHGIHSTAPILDALNRNHPGDLDDADPLPTEERDTLLQWLNSDRVSEDYDNLDLGDLAPAEIIAARCLECHARSSTRAENEVGQRIPLEFWPDVEAVAFSREIYPTSIEILVISTHTHALSLAAIGIVITLLLLRSRLPRLLTSLAILTLGVGLLADLGGQWLARAWIDAVYLVVLGGGSFMIVGTLAAVLLLFDLWWPRTRAAS